MSEENNVEEILRRLDEVLIVLKGVLSDLQEIGKTLRSMGGGSAPSPAMPSPQPSPTAAPAPMTPSPTTAGRTREVQDLRMMFPKELEDLLNFSEKETYIMIKPRQYLGSENFAKIASIIRGAGGEYISAGKDSHFRIPKHY